MREIQSPSEIKKMSVREMQALAAEIREEIIRVVSEQGGHLSSNLGAVELTLALHYVFNSPEDKLIFDVGHQTYTHKLLTGRRKSFQDLRSRNGTSGFPQIEESEHDSFTAGHASTALSAALGLARTRDIMHGENHVVAVVRDGALTGGMCYEALNDAGQVQTKLIVILNDNEMSISANVGALSSYLTHLRQSKSYCSIKRGVRRFVSKIPVIGLPVFRFIERIKESLKSLLLDGRFFSALGFEYMGPIDGHDLKHMIRIFRRAKDSDKPVLIHVMTQKGRGYRPAENHPDQFHGVASFYTESGETKGLDKVVPCGRVVGKLLAEMADVDYRICAITAAMRVGTGMDAFMEAHPDRFYDVGIAEEHAVTMAAGMAYSGMKPYLAVYSTFMQRCYDQMLIDVCRNSLPVTFLLDRAGLVGSDGATHQGVFDLSYMRSIPNLIIAAPRDIRDLKKVIALSAEIDEPFAIRYPKDCDDMGPGIQAQHELRVGQWEMMNDGDDVMIFAVGRMVQMAMQAGIELMGKGISAGIVDARFIKPMDAEMLVKLATKVKLVVTVEENTVEGGFGEGVLRLLQEHCIRVDTLTLGVPDRFIDHGSVSLQLAECGLNGYGISQSILKRWMERKA